MVETYKNKAYEAAGIIFCNNTHILAGFQEDSKTQTYSFSGIGGKKEQSDLSDGKITAIREMLEELFDIQEQQEKQNQNKDKVNMIVNQIYMINVNKYIYHNEYINFIYNFDQLEQILCIIKANNYISKYYDEIPQTIFDLVCKRNKVEGEIQSLAIVPIQSELYFNKCFIQDIKELENKTILMHTFDTD